MFPQHSTPDSILAGAAPATPFNATAAEKIRLVMALRTAGITDRNVLSAIEQVPREFFVPDAFRDHAYEDKALPIEMGQTISQPSIVAWMTWALEVTDRSRVLEIGTGSGYQAAVLARLCRMVYTIEQYHSMYQQAAARFDAMGLHNITTKFGDGSKGWPEAAPFDRIIVTAAAGEVPKNLIDQLADGGIMVIPVGPVGGTQMLLRIHKQGDDIATQHLMPVRFVPLITEEG